MHTRTKIKHPNLLLIAGALTVVAIAGIAMQLPEILRDLRIERM